MDTESDSNYKKIKLGNEVTKVSENKSLEFEKEEKNWRPFTKHWKLMKLIQLNRKAVRKQFITTKITIKLIRKN